MDFYINQVFDTVYPPEAAIWCNSNGAYIVNENGKYIIKEVPKPTAKELQLERLRNELEEKEKWLKDHDYIGTKIATGRATVAEYQEEINTMNNYASAISLLKSQIKSLES